MSTPESSPSTETKVQFIESPPSTEPEKKIKFLIISRYCWGNGETYDEAVKNLQRAGGDKWNVVYMWPGPYYPRDAGVYGWGQVEWSGTADRPILIQDNRRVPDKRKDPLKIGEVLGHA